MKKLLAVIGLITSTHFAFSWPFTLVGAEWATNIYSWDANWNFVKIGEVASWPIDIQELPGYPGSGLFDVVLVGSAADGQQFEGNFQLLYCPVFEVSDYSGNLSDTRVDIAVWSPQSDYLISWNYVAGSWPQGLQVSVIGYHCGNCASIVRKGHNKQPLPTTK